MTPASTAAPAGREELSAAPPSPSRSTTRTIAASVLRTFDPARIHQWKDQVPPEPSADVASLVKTLVGLARSNPVGSDATAQKAEQDAHIDVLVAIWHLERKIVTLTARAERAEALLTPPAAPEPNPATSGEGASDA